MENTHSQPKHKNIQELSQKLQNEINLIINNVNEKAIYSEFREHEIFDIQNGDKRDHIENTLDERIMMGRNAPRPIAIQRIERTTISAAKKLTYAQRLFGHLFRPLQY